MHQIISGINTNKLLDKLNIRTSYSYPCIYIIHTTLIVIDYSMYSTVYKEDSKEPVDITENQLDKAITLYELLEDSKLALESLRN